MDENQLNQYIFKWIYLSFAKEIDLLVSVESRVHLECVFGLRFNQIGAHEILVLLVEGSDY